MANWDVISLEAILVGCKLYGGSLAIPVLFPFNFDVVSLNEGVIGFLRVPPGK